MSFRTWLKQQYEEDELRALAHHGAQGGFSGMIYYTETTALYNEYEEDIWEMLSEDADNLGQTPLELIASFNGAKQVENHTHFANLLVWYAAERLAEEVADELDEEREEEDHEEPEDDEQ